MATTTDKMIALLDMTTVWPRDEIIAEHYLTCVEHPNLRWHSKNPWSRSVHYFGEAVVLTSGSEGYDLSTPECECPFENLRVRMEVDVSFVNASMPRPKSEPMEWEIAARIDHVIERRSLPLMIATIMVLEWSKKAFYCTVDADFSYAACLHAPDGSSIPNNESTIDHKPVEYGMRVWDYDLRVAIVDSVNHVDQAGTIWYNTKSEDGKRRGTFDAKRMWFRHPSNGKLA